MENNQIVLVGYAVKDAELRYTKTGKAVCLFSIATNKRISVPFIMSWHGPMQKK